VTLPEPGVTVTVGTMSGVTVTDAVPEALV
jgi:hypothetical protein